jgi:hypothetical protein
MKAPNLGLPSQATPHTSGLREQNNRGNGRHAVGP